MLGRVGARALGFVAVRELPAEIQREASVLFHDARLCDVDPDAHASFVIERVLERGTMRSVRALLRAYGEERLRVFLRDGGAGRVSRPTARLWQNYLRLSDEECSRGRRLSTPRPAPVSARPRRTARSGLRIRSLPADDGGDERA